jgi:FtsH-binding integral membrane protein
MWQPAIEAPVEARVAFLRKVGGMTLMGLLIATASALASMSAVLVVPALSHGWVPLIVMLASVYGSQFIGSAMVQSQDSTTRLAGFVLGTGLMGVGLGYLLLAAALFSAAAFGNPMVVVGEAGALVALSVVGMVMYLLTGPRNLSMIGGALSVMTLPMLGLMVIGLFFPFGGVFGLLLSVGFVAMSAGGLLFNLNQVIHRMSTDQVVPAAFHITIGILVLFWNVVTLLMKLQRR